MSAETKAGNGSQLRLLQVIEALSGNEVFGVRLTDVAQAVASSAPNVLRDLQTLARAGWTEQLGDGKWRLAAKPIQIAVSFQWGLAEAQAKVAEVEQRYTRRPS